DPDAETSSIRKPLHRDAYAAAVNSTGAYAANRIDQIKRGQGIDATGANPTDSDQYTRECDYQTRPEAIDQVRVNREEHGLCDDEESQRPLHRVKLHMQSPRDVGGEKSPGVLKIRDHQHRDYAWQKDRPTSGCLR